MRRTLVRDPIFWICILILTSLLLMSFGNTIFRDGQVDRISNRYADDGTFIATSPLKPSLDQWLGTDRSGNDLVQMMIEGFKWTFGVCAFVALGRLILGLMIGIPLAFRGKRLHGVLKVVMDGFLVLPVSLLALMLMLSSLIFPEKLAVPYLSDRLTFEFTILIALGLPSLVLYIIGETRQILTQEFMVVASTLGGGTWHRFRRHLWPHLVPTLSIIFMQQFIQTLMLLVQLSLFGIFFSGTVILYEGITPLIFEWASMFGYYFNQFSAVSWINHMFLVPTIGIALLIFLCNLLTSRLERAYRIRRHDQPVIEETSIVQHEAAVTSLDDPFAPVRHHIKQETR